MLRCPDCLGPMARIDHRGAELDACRNCHGLWFDRGELAQLEGFKRDLPEVKYAASRELARKKCPRCDVGLQQRRYLESHPVFISTCPRCRGIFLDRDGYRRIMALRGERANRDRVVVSQDPAVAEVMAHYQVDADRELQSSDWLFQFFTGLPVEINLPPLRQPLVNLTLVLANIAVFLLTFSTLRQVITGYGLVPATFMQHGQLWALFSSMFLHAGFMHLLGNMYFLWVLGDNVEDHLGHVWYALFYLASGVAAAMSYVVLHAGSAVPMVGASGAVSGVIGAYIIACPKAKLTFMLVIWQFKISVYWYFGLWFAFQALAWAGGVSGVAWEAHIGGFLFGLAAFSILRGVRERAADVQT